MRDDLFSCPGCARHVRRSSAVCPFCRCDVTEAARLAPVRRRPTERLGRGATFAFGAAALTVAGCSSAHDADAGVVPIYGGPDAPDAVVADAMAIDGGPDAPLDAAAPTDASTSVDAATDASEPDADMDAGDIAIYGGPPPPGD